ncbi:HTH-type transcriptional regulator / antitoxin HigA [Algoriphagus locisalis]|uniref:HTH-type transcriptional regulator / antitoxin HigA n=1 Tax=Algoriphagus locisalis TaxID=305507 RepID=A0A1I7BTS2_9BACT|nr:transcriptional regulator [Algoriphagus locisalis]SFT90580.1 HTH-type transcriptional regulator / antitoxin HigA [Algoriphagus locisalis]
MELSVIKSDEQYSQYLDWVEEQLDLKISKESPEGKKLEVALLIIKEYEDQNFQIPTPDPIEIIKQKMVEMGVRNKDLVGKVGSKGYISSILNRRKPMTLEIAKIFHKELNIPAEVLLP